jgi:ribosomal protein S18 acetylase RimI-like enzyme
MDIRKVTEKDLSSIQLLLNRNFDEIMSHYHSSDILNKFKKLNTIESLSGQLSWKQIYVVTDNKRIVGTGSFANFGTKEHPKYSVSNLYVLPELHKQGIGKIIITQLLEEAKENDPLELHVPSSRNGIGFYEKMGFKVDNEQPDIQDEITWMTRKLAGE